MFVLIASLQGIQVLTAAGPHKFLSGKLIQEGQLSVTDENFFVVFFFFAQVPSSHLEVKPAQVKV